jgi:hypothetical protein
MQVTLQAIDQARLPKLRGSQAKKAGAAACLELHW